MPVSDYWWFGKNDLGIKFSHLPSTEFLSSFMEASGAGHFWWQGTGLALSGGMRYAKSNVPNLFPTCNIYVKPNFLFSEGGVEENSIFSPSATFTHPKGVNWSGREASEEHWKLMPTSALSSNPSSWWLRKSQSAPFERNFSLSQNCSYIKERLNLKLKHATA